MERAELEKIIREKLKEIMENSSEQSVSEKKIIHLWLRHREDMFICPRNILSSYLEKGMN